MRKDIDLILMVLSGATLLVFTLAVVGAAFIGGTLFGV
jgi:hypothetical protein